MSDNHSPYRSIRTALAQMCRKDAKENDVRRRDGGGREAQKALDGSRQISYFMQMNRSVLWSEVAGSSR
jgi:hypothetical protein